MAITHGKAGSVTRSDADVAYVTGWSVDATCGTADATNMASTNDFREYLAGFRDWTATVETNVTAGVTVTTLLGGTSATNLTDGTLTWTGGTTTLCTGFSLSCGYDDVVKATYVFQGSVTEPTWAT